MMKPYPDYKDSGVAWLGKIPAHWKVILVKNFYHIQLGKMLQPEKKLHDDLSFPYLKALHVQWFRVEQESLPEMWGQPSDIEKYGVKSGDLLVCEGGEGGRAAIIANLSKPCIIQNALHRVRSKAGSNLKFLQYVMFVISSTGWFDAICNKATIAHFTKEKFGSLKIAIPPIEEQTKIVLFLDEKIAKIDRFIANKQRMAALLREQKQAVITAAVTGKLDVCGKKRNAKDASGARDARAWFGDIPSHWEVRRLKMIADIRYGLGQPPQELSSGIRMIRATNVDHGKILEKDMLYVDPKEIPIERNPFLKEDEIIVVRSGAYTADSAIIPQQYAGSIAGYDMVVTVTKAYPKFIASALLSKYVLDDQLFLLRLRAAQPHINAEELGNTLILLPSIEEQKKIALFVSETSRKIETIIARIEREIDLMQEYRARLIADVVTGQIDAREKL